MTFQLVLPVLFALGVGFGGLVGWSARRSYSTVRHGLRTNGRVARITESPEGSRFAVVEYVVEGERHELEMPAGPLEPGRTVTICHRRDHPGRAVPATFAGLWSTPLMMAGVALLLTGGPTLAWIMGPPPSQPGPAGAAAPAAGGTQGPVREFVK